MSPDHFPTNFHAYRIRYSCPACPWRGDRPSMTDASDVDPRSGQVRRIHIAVCPQCGTNVRCERVA